MHLSELHKLVAGQAARIDLLERKTRGHDEVLRDVLRRLDTAEGAHTPDGGSEGDGDDTGAHDGPKKTTAKKATPKKATD